MSKTNKQEIDFEEVAAQLRKPEGEFGKIVAQKMNEGNKIITELTYNSVSKYPCAIVLEIGFGNGFFIPELLKNGHKKVCGIDYSDLMLAEANENLIHFIIEKKVELKWAAADAIPYPENYFDKICSVNTIYFWDEPLKVISEIKRVLQPGGIVSVGYRSKTRMQDLEFAKYDFKMYEIKDVENLFVKNGFELLETIVVDEEIYDAVCTTFKKGG